MSGNGKSPQPFAVPPGTPLIGQPVTIVSLYIPVTVTFLCNCTTEDREPLTIHDGVAVTCPRCRQVYNAFQHPEKLQMRIDKPSPEQVPS